MIAVQIDFMAEEVPAYSCGTSVGAYDVATSIEAAESVDEHAESCRMRVLSVLREYGPLAGEQIREVLHADYPILPRITELSKRGLVVRTGERHTNASGRSAFVWRAA